MSKRSKDIIADALIHLMQSSSYDEITISEVCANTSLVRKTFYNNFNSKDEVIAYVVEDLVREYHDSIREVNVYSPKEMSYLYFCFGKKHQEILTMLFENNLFHLFRTEFEKNLPQINAQVPNNKLNILDDVDLEYVFAFHTAGVIRMLELWIKNGFNKSAREMSGIYHTISLGYQDESSVQEE